MLVVVTYDVNTETGAGKARLRKVAKKCVAYGQRVQNSVFECLLDEAQLVTFQAELVSLINPKTDSLRIYKIGNNYKNKINHFGLQSEYPQDEILII